MAKYRDLTHEEFITFEKEFVDYLVVNGITADDWVKMKEENVEKAEKIMALFSDVVMESVLRKIQFLEIRTKAYNQAVHCLPDKMLMVAISSKDENKNMFDFDPTKDDENMGDSFELHTGEKKYLKSRELELYEMTVNGYEVSDGKLYKALYLATAE